MSQPTLGELDALVRNDLSEGGRQFFTPEAIRGYLNEGQDFVLAESLHSIAGSWKITSVKNASEYLLDEDCLAPRALYVTNSSGQPYRVDFEQEVVLDQWTSMGSATTRASIVSRVTYGHCAEGVKMRIQPLLDNYYKMLYVGSKRMKRLVNVTDRTECPVGLQHVLVHYAVMMCKLKDEEGKQADQWAGIVRADVLQVRSRATREGTSDRLPRAQIRRRGRGWFR